MPSQNAVWGAPPQAPASSSSSDVAPLAQFMIPLNDLPGDSSVKNGDDHQASGTTGGQPSLIQQQQQQQQQQHKTTKQKSLSISSINHLGLNQQLVQSLISSRQERSQKRVPSSIRRQHKSANDCWNSEPSGDNNHQNSKFLTSSQSSSSLSATRRRQSTSRKQKIGLYRNHQTSRSLGSLGRLSIHSCTSLTSIVEETVNPIDGRVVEIENLPSRVPSFSSHASSLDHRSKGSKNSLSRTSKRHLRRGGSMLHSRRKAKEVGYDSNDLSDSVSTLGADDVDMGFDSSEGTDDGRGSTSSSLDKLSRRGKLRQHPSFTELSTTSGRDTAPKLTRRSRDDPLDEIRHPGDFIKSPKRDLTLQQKQKHPSFSDLSSAAGSKDSAPKLRPRKHHIKAFVNAIRKLHDLRKLVRCNELDVLASERAWDESRGKPKKTDDDSNSDYLKEKGLSYHVRTGSSLTEIRDTLINESNHYRDYGRKQDDDTNDKAVEQLLSTEYSKFGMGLCFAPDEDLEEDVIYLCHIFR